MNPIKAVERMSRQGQKLEVFAVVTPTGVWVESRINGVVDVRITRPTETLPKSIKDMGFIAAVGRIPLTESEIGAVNKALEVARTSHAMTPDGLRSKRESLVTLLVLAESDEQHTRERAWDTEDETGAFQADPAVAKARKDLSDFDEAYPEVLQSLRDEAKAVARDHMWD